MNHNLIFELWIIQPRQHPRIIPETKLRTLSVVSTFGGQISLLIFFIPSLLFRFSSTFAVSHLRWRLINVLYICVARLRLGLRRIAWDQLALDNWVIQKGVIRCACSCCGWCCYRCIDWRTTLSRVHYFLLLQWLIVQTCCLPSVWWLRALISQGVRLLLIMGINIVHSAVFHLLASLLINCRYKPNLIAMNNLITTSYGYSIDSRACIVCNAVNLIWFSFLGSWCELLFLLKKPLSCLSLHWIERSVEAN